MVTIVSKSNGLVGDQRTLAHLLAPLPNGDYAVTVEPKWMWERRQPRTTDQNALMWAYFADIARLWNMEYGDTYWDSKAVHDFFCDALASEEIAPDGRPWRRPVSTSRLTKRAMSQFIERVSQYLASECGMRVPLPGDDDYNIFHESLQHESL